MQQLSDIVPQSKFRVMDLVGAAGIDTTDWKNFAGGELKAATNPKYCYEWGFIEPHRVIALNLWLEHMKQGISGEIVTELNAREWGRGRPVWQARAGSLDRIIRTAFEEELPVRAIVCVGKVRNPLDSDSKPSQVAKRDLDPVPWAITLYDARTGRCTITRGVSPGKFIDQFSERDLQESSPTSREIFTKIFDRDPLVRGRVRRRAKGKCELCGEVGFETNGGLIYIETHHVVPLSEGGSDIDKNVVALCPNHHREAHHGSNKMSIRDRLLGHLASLYSGTNAH